MPPDPIQILDPQTLLRAMWPVLKALLAVVIAVGLIRAALWLIKWTYLLRAGMPEIDRMSGRDFEEKISLLLQAKGYHAHPTPYVGDWGADLIVSREGRRSVVQLKRWNRSVNIKAIQEVVASKAKYGCDQAMVITNAQFTHAARELARANSVELWDRQRLARELLQEQRGPKPGAPVVSSSNRPSPVLPDPTPRCARCGQVMVRR
jgi:restriction system protein